MIDAAKNIPSAWGVEFGSYQVLQELDAGKSVLAIAPGNRQIVLKLLDPDCLAYTAHQPKLHPNIRDRLARIREVAHGRIANLHGVDYIHGQAYLVWEHCAGETLDKWAVGRNISVKSMMLVARELILTLESLHARGIVHGAIHARNIIVDPQGNLKLTHISPLLYSDPQRDLSCMAEMLSDLARQRDEVNSPLDQLALEANQRGATLHAMGTQASMEIDFDRHEANDAAGDRHRRRVARLIALAVVLFAGLLFYGIQQYARHLAPTVATPPDASSESMRPADPPPLKPAI